MNITMLPEETRLYVGSFIHSLSLRQLEYVTEGIIVVSGPKILLKENSANRITDIQQQFNVKPSNVHRLQKGQFLLPGFVDTHIHAPQYPNLGLGYDLPLLDWLEKYTFPLEKKFEDDNFAQRVYDAVVKKTIANGTTTACYFATIHKSACCILANSVKKLGQRAFIGKVNMNINSPAGYKETFEKSLNVTKEFIEFTKALNCPLITPIITPRFALSCNMELMKALGKMAADFGLPIQTHVSENLKEIELVKQEYADCKNYVDVYDKAGLLTNKTILAHGVHLTTEEIEVLKRKGSTISHCASSNTLLQSGVCPVERYLRLGLKVSLGTDCSGGNSCSVLDSIRETLKVSIQASFNNIGKKLSHEEVFFMATLGGAEAIGLQNIIGNFTVDKDFDAILVDMNNPEALDLLEDYSLQQLFEKFLYLGDDRVIKTVFVSGKVVKKK